MGINYFTLKEGVLELHIDKLIIFDNAKRERVSQLLYLLGLLVYSSGSFFRGLKDGEPSIIFIGIILLLIFVSYVFKRKK